MKVPSFDLKEQYASLREELLPLLDSVMSGGQFILGEQVRMLEQEVAEYVGAGYGIGVANGSDALHLALMVCGVGPGDEVMVPAFTFFATAGSVIRAGATPVFIDIDPDTFNIDVKAVEGSVSASTKAVIPVHLYGQSAAMEVLMQVARKHNLRVIEDAAQAIGARRNGQPVCTFGDVGTLSFFPTKNLGAFGDAGFVLSNDGDLAEKVRRLRVHGAKVKYFHEEPGYNSRLDEMQAAILRVKLKRLKAWTNRRREIAARYDTLLKQAGIASLIAPPVEAEGNFHVYHQYTVKAEARDELQKFLAERGVGATVYYPWPLHLLPVFRSLKYKVGDLPVAEDAAAHVLSLPMFPELSSEQQEYVVEQIVAFYAGEAGH